MTDFFKDPRPWHHVGHRILRPFPDIDPGKPVDGREPLNVSYCLRCKEYGTGRKQGAFEGTVYAVKVSCGRCGTVISYAIFNQQCDESAGRRALAWATSAEPVTITQVPVREERAS